MGFISACPLLLAESHLMVSGHSKKYHREKIIQDLKKKNIETVLGTYAMHALASYKKFGYKPGDLPNSYLAYSQSLTLPLYAQLTDKEINYIIKCLKESLMKK